MSEVGEQVFELKIAHLRELLEIRDAALELQAKEYERRLAELNHAHARQEEVQLTYVGRSTYDARNLYVDQLLKQTDIDRQRLEKDIVLRIAAGEHRIGALQQWQARWIGIVIGVNAMAMLLFRFLKF